MYETILYGTMPENIHVLTINRPEANNKLSIPCMRELIDAIGKCSEDKSCSCIMLTGYGEVFCCGGELGDFRIKSALDIKAFGAALIDLFLCIRKCPKPVVAVVNGNAFGGGFSLVEACDLAVADENALFAVPEILDGLAPAIGLSGIFSNLTKKQVMELGLLGKKLSAGEALALGMINAVASKENLMEKAVESASFFARANPTCIRLFKEMYYDMEMCQFENRLKIGQSMLIAMLMSDDCREVLDSKDENRAPVWKG